ncbi:site-specific DNA-methyltransferase [Bathymodiolus japonicus methanotrophic gill symbiont]|uniref:site-specific DNA-methyltransferase n=1 Tax=Bathymodiolus japonicus methanotrophic gill symbiont TaxID=113269 RepID=UPI001E4C0B21|nr:site-specific DNA-methyltransferase [Bathymodiolus japonicus methanotrophic gill symbiont]
MEQIAKLFPNVMTETQDENGNNKRAIDFDLLKQSLSSVLVDNVDERYRLDWPGKKAALLKANTPITKTLRPCRDDSVNFDSTENVYIEGDNFEVLKILQESYLGKIKMIYIDPPYNTGKDFIYKDNFAAKKADYEEELGTTDEEDNKLFRNTDTNGRFHSDWLSMMYERLVVARDLLKEDGVIFISIDDNEVHNLRKICDDVFGEENFVAEIIWQSKSGGGHDEKCIVKESEYIVCFSKTKNITKFGRRIIENPNYKLSDQDEPIRGKYLTNKLDRMMRGEHYSDALNYSILSPDNTEIWPGNTGKKTGDWNWRWSRTKVDWGIKNNFIVIKKGNNNNWAVYSKQYEKMDHHGKVVERNYPYRNVVLSSEYNTTQGGNELQKIFMANIFDYAKPSKFVGHILKMSGVMDDDIIIDLFSGSATTSHAVMQLNAEDKGTRKFIMVQLPEATDEKSEAYKAGYKNIAEIGKERIRRAGTNIVEDNQNKIGIDKLDIGFRVYKTDSSNMEEVYYHPEQLSQDNLFSLASNIKEERTPDDLLTQVILNLGLELNLPIEQKKMHGNSVFIVQTNALVACFDDNINIQIIDEIAQLQPFRVVFKDGGFSESKDRINLEERFKRLSHETLITVI